MRFEEKSVLRESGMLIILRLYFSYAYIFKDKNQTSFDLSEIKGSQLIVYDILVL